MPKPFTPQQRAQIKEEIAATFTPAEKAELREWIASRPPQSPRRRKPRRR